uniref:Putative transcription factor HY5-like isoform X3 n=1 Tax=Cymbidium ensifolium TaxID=78740 RepID=A0A5C1YU64_CYMEN|nr:putative transcription factor HY5-like isoform X3 [Cymbidium ensifolium]
MSSLPAGVRPAPPLEAKPEDSDEDLFTVPDVESAPGSSSPATAVEARKGSGEGPSKTRKGRNPAEREYRRLKRLLRNRVSAQQARERKKVYLNELESAAKELLQQNMKLEEKISTLVNENTMLRKVLMNSRPKIDDSVELNEKNGKV